MTTVDSLAAGWGAGGWGDVYGWLYILTTTSVPQVVVKLNESTHQIHGTALRERRRKKRKKKSERKKKNER